MKNKKVLGFLLGFAVLCSIAIPGVWAVETQANSAPGSDSVSVSSVQIPDTEGSATGESAAQDSTTDSVQENGPDTMADTGAEQPTTETVTADHIAGCSDACTGQDCTCPCHTRSLFDRLMACDTLDELYAIADTATEEEILALTDEQNAQLEAKVSELEQAAPAQEQEMLDDEAPEEDAPVPSVIIYPTVNFDHVAPLGEPAEG